MGETLALLKHRVTDVELADQEAIHAGVITALNEEAVICAALGNKGGLNIAVIYEAFAVKMQSALRQEIIFAAHAKANGTPARWLSVPLLLTSRTWENGKNEQSHQDPSLVEAMFGEASDVVRVEGRAYRTLGYRSRGGTLDAAGMLFANACTWTHAVCATAQLLHVDAATWLEPDELAAVAGRGREN